jgi:hypothetical protein
MNDRDLDPLLSAPETRADARFTLAVLASLPPARTARRPAWRWMPLMGAAIGGLVCVLTGGLAVFGAAEGSWTQPWTALAALCGALGVVAVAVAPGAADA